MYINRGFLVNERSARHIGIQRGSVGSFDPCYPDRVSTRAITDKERAQARITGTSDRSFLLGSWQQEQSDINRARLGSDFARFQADRADKYDVVKPKGLRTGPVKGKPARKASAPKPAPEPEKPVFFCRDYCPYFDPMGVDGCPSMTK